MKSYVYQLSKLSTSQPNYIHNLISAQSTCRTRSSSDVTRARPSVSSSLQITNRSFRYAMHHLTRGFSSLLHSVNLILFTVLLVHFILRISPHHSHHLHSHHLPLPQPFALDLKLISFTNPFLHSFSDSFWTAFTETRGWRLFVLVASFFIFFFGCLC